MWSSKGLAPPPGRVSIFFLLLPLVFGLPSCGFEPVYGASAGAPSAAASLAGVEIGNIPDAGGQYLRNQLLDRLNAHGRPADAPYMLRVSSLRSSTTSMGVETNGTVTRAMAELTATMQLFDKPTGKLLLQREVRAAGGYNELNNEFATLVSHEAVDDHMLEELADDITTQLGLYFRLAAEKKDGLMPVSVAAPLRNPATPLSTEAVPSAIGLAPPAENIPVAP
jgi:hypothetical protein